MQWLLTLCLAPLNYFDAHLFFHEITTFMLCYLSPLNMSISARAIKIWLHFIFQKGSQFFSGHLEIRVSNIKFIYSEKATQFCKISTLLLTGTTQRVIRRESKTDSYSKDLLFLACVAFCVITFEPIMI